MSKMREVTRQIQKELIQNVRIKQVEKLEADIKRLRSALSNIAEQSITANTLAGMSHMAQRALDGKDGSAACRRRINGYN